MVVVESSDGTPLLDSGPADRNEETKAYIFRQWERLIWENGPLLVLASACLFPVESMLVKMVSGAVSPLELVFVRGLIMCMFSLLKSMAGKSKGPVLGHRKNMHLLASIGLAVFIMTVSSWFALIFIPMADVFAIIFMNTVFIAILSRALRLETWSLYTPAAILCSFVGVILVTRPPMIFASSAISWTSERYLGVGLSLCASVSCAPTYIFTNFLKKRERSEVILLWQCFVGLVLSAILLLCGIPKQVFHLSYHDWTLAFLSAGVGIIGWMLLFRSVSLTSPTVAVVLGTSELVWCYCADMVVFGQPFSILSAAGGFGIAAGSVIIVHSVKAK